MKKILLGICALGLFASCDPSKDSVGVPAPISESELASGFTYTQTDEAGSPSATGNFFQYTAPRVVTIYRLNSSGGQVILAKGSSAGSFILKPTRGSDPSQTFYVQSREFDGSVVTASYNVTVEVPGDLTLEMKIACSDNGTKTWKWDTESFPGQWFEGAVWGNLGYTPGDGTTFINDGNGVWWGCPPADLTGQLQHSNTGVATGEEDPRAYMIFSEEGTITTYDAGGNQIRKGAFEIKDYNNGNRSTVNDVAWSLGTLHTDAATILFPFKINGGGVTPTDFEILELTADKMKLVYADAGTGGWSEATWWAFKSESDGAGCLNNYDKKEWTWDTESFPGQWFEGAVWGNLGYTPGDGDTFVNDGNGVWWGCPPADLTGQLQHSDTGAATGEEDPNAYMVFDIDGAVTTYSGSGSKIRGGAYELKFSATRQPMNDVAWNFGTLETDPGVILFPFQINGGGTKVGHFEVMQLSAEKMKLIYAPDGTGGWSEATWWAFKAKK